VSLIERDKIPIELLELRDDVKRIVSRHADIESARLHLLGENLIAHFLCGDKVDNSETGCPLLEFLHPVADRALRGNHEMGLLHFLGLIEIRDVGDGLNGLAEAHFIRQNAIHLVLVQ